MTGCDLFAKTTGNLLALVGKVEPAYRPHLVLRSLCGSSMCCHMSTVFMSNASLGTRVNFIASASANGKSSDY